VPDFSRDSRTRHQCERGLQGERVFWKEVKAAPWCFVLNDHVQRQKGGTANQGLEASNQTWALGCRWSGNCSRWRLQWQLQQGLNEGSHYYGHFGEFICVHDEAS
jgi:hypothetical protein